MPATAYFVARYATAALFVASMTTTLLQAESPPGYRLVWSDEFDHEGPPNRDKWSFERGFVRNKEAQWYQPENAECRDGVLVITARHERRPNPAYDPEGRDWRATRPHAEYTSSCLITRGKYSWKYGILEVRARIDARPGLWPAVWTLGNEGRWPACGEVDLMEYYRGDLLGNACWLAPHSAAGGRELSRQGRVMWDAVNRPLAGLGDEHWPHEFHVWRMDWDERRIRLLVDESLVNEIDLSEVTNPTNGPAPFHQPHYLLLNLAIGGTQGGDPSETTFPATFEVDYVRVYQTPEASGEPLRGGQ